MDVSKTAPMSELFYTYVVSVCEFELHRWGSTVYVGNMARTEATRSARRSSLFMK